MSENLGRRQVLMDALRVATVAGAGAAGLSGSPVDFNVMTGKAFVVVTLDPDLTAERALAVGAGLTLADGGANNNITLDLNDAVAGAGLTIASKVLNVGAGAGITVNANDVALTTPGTLSVGSTNNAAGNHTHAVTTSSNPGAAAAILATTVDGYLQLVRLGVGVAPGVALQVQSTGETARFQYDASNYFSITVSSGGNATLGPTGDLVFDPVGNDVLPATGYNLNIGAINRKYLTVHAAELWVETLVAQNTIATIGGRILVGPTTTLIADVDTAQTTIDVKHNNLANGDRVYLEADGKVEFMAVTSGATGISGGYRYSVTRNLDGTGANDWFAGDAVFNTGQAGNGFIDLYSLRGVKAASQVGPTIVGNVRNSATFNDWTEHWAIGNLNGLYGYGVDTYGVAVGKYSATTSWLAADATNGVRIMRGSTALGQWQVDGDLFLGTNIGAAATTNLAIFNVAQTYNGESVDVGDLLLGDNSSNKANVFWDRSTGRLNFRGGTTVHAFIDTDGQIHAGNSSVRIGNNGISMLVSSAYAAQAALKFYDNTGATLLGRLYQYQASVGSLIFGGYQTEPVSGYDNTIQLFPSTASGRTSRIVLAAGSVLGGYSTTVTILAGPSQQDVTIDRGLNIGTATGAATGDMRYSGVLASYKNSTYYTGYIFVPLTSPLTSTSWDGDSYSTTAKTLIDLSAVFGAPAGVAAILAIVSMRDSGSASGDYYLILSPNNTSGQGPVARVSGLSNDAWNSETLMVPCDANGDIYYQIVASGSLTMDVYIQIWGYWI